MAIVVHLNTGCSLLVKTRKVLLVLCDVYKWAEFPLNAEYVLVSSVTAF